MKRFRQVALLTTALASTLAAQQFTIPFSGGSRAQTVRITLLNGGIEIRGYNGKDVVLDSTGGSPGKHKDKDKGPRRIDIANGFSLNEDSNVITIQGGNGSPQLSLQVPFQTNLELKCTNCGETQVSNVSGDIDVNTTNSGIRLTNVSGSVLAHSLNHGIVASFDRAPQKSVSLSTLNGGLDVTVPGDTKANLNLKTSNGKIYSDFDVRLAGGTLMQPGKGLAGTINGGGIEMRLASFNGSIYLRRR